MPKTRTHKNISTFISRTQHIMSKKTRMYQKLNNPKQKVKTQNYIYIYQSNTARYEQKYTNKIWTDQENTQIMTTQEYTDMIWTAQKNQNYSSVKKIFVPYF